MHFSLKQKMPNMIGQPLLFAPVFDKILLRVLEIQIISQSLLFFVNRNYFWQDPFCCDSAGFAKRKVVSNIQLPLLNFLVLERV